MREEDGSRMRGKKPGIWAIAALVIMIMTLCGLAVGVYRKNNAVTQISLYAGKALEGEPFSYAFIEFRPGYDNLTGEVFYQAVTGSDGVAVAALPPGEYTVKWYGGGYSQVYQNVEVGEEPVTLKKWMVPSPEEGAAYILVEWDSEADADLYVYSEQNDRCLGRETTLGNPGGLCYGDNDGEKGYELVSLDDLSADTYLVYVKNNVCSVKNRPGSRDSRYETVVSYTDLCNIAGKASDMHAVESMSVSIYTADGLLYQKTPGREKRAGLWIGACIREGKVQERDEQIYPLEDYAWAARDKENPLSWADGAAVKAEETYEYNRSDGTLIRIREERFDREGNQTALYSRNSGGELSSAYELEYDEKGQLVCTCDYGDQGKGFGLVSKSEYEYEEGGRKVRCYFYIIESGTENLFDQYEWEYDENGRETVRRYYDGDGTLTGTTQYEYDAAGHELSSCWYDGDGVIWSETIREYDERGNETAVYSYRENHILEDKTEYVWDAEGNCISSCGYDENGVITVRITHEYDEDGYCRASYTYNAQGELTHKIERDVFGNQTGNYYYKDGELTDWWDQVYDAEGRVLESYEYNDGKLYRRREWEYNESGECTAVRSYIGNSSYAKVTRYARVHVYDAVGGMEIFYEYVNGILVEKKIILYY